MQATSSPTLAPPGAGLPWIELQIARGIFGTGRMISSRAKAELLFRNEREKLLELIQPFSEKDLSQRVLIRRLRGLEDSSRNWSAYMTLSHLAIVNNAVCDAIELLCKGQVPAQTASTALVKPKPDIGIEAVKEFQDAADRFLTISREAPDLSTSCRYNHPWFGPLDASGWHFMAGFHMRLHRRQLESILASLCESWAATC